MNRAVTRRHARKIAAKDAPVLAMSFKLGQIGNDGASTHALLAYDDLYSIRYFNTDLKAYWTKDGVARTLRP